METLKSRLASRGTEAPDAVEKRLRSSKVEYDESGMSALAIGGGGDGGLSCCEKL